MRFFRANPTFHQILLAEWCMTIHEAWIEDAYPNQPDDAGWVLAVRGSWGASTHGSFDLDANATPRAVLTVSGRQGFGRSAGEAAPLARSVQLRVTDTLRRPWPNQAQIDETDNGDGTRTVRLALEDYVYSGETVTLSVLAGWRTGLPAQTNIPVTNNCTRAAPKPWGHWSCPPDQLVDGSVFTPEMVCVSLYPQHDGPSLHQPVAGVRFTASDGTNSVSAWVTQMTTSTVLNDDLLVWRAPMDLSALNSGRVTIHAEVYPWVGPMWSTKEGPFTTDHIVDWTVSLYPLPEKPLMITLDKGGFLPRRHIVLAPPGQGNPLATAADCMRNTLAEAQAVPLADRPESVQRAMDLMAQVQLSVPAANGYAALTNNRFGQGKFVWIPEGTFPILGNALGFLSGIRTEYFGAQIAGLPGTSREQVVVTHSGSWDQRFNSYRMRGLTINRTVTGTLHGGSVRHMVFENVAVTGTPGNYRSSTPPNVYGTSVTKADSHDYFFGCDFAANNGMSGGCGVLRSTQNGAGRGNLFVQSGSSATLQVVWDGHISLNNAHFGQTNPAIVPVWGEPTNDTGNPGTRNRLAVINCLYERVAGGNVSIQVGEGSNNQIRDVIFDGVTIVGGRWNLHNDPPAGGNNRHRHVYRVGCIINRNATKHDVFNGSGIATGAWSIMHSLGLYDSFIGDRIGDTISTNVYDLRFVGLNTVRGNLIPGFTAEQFANGFVADRTAEAAGGGNGDYRLTQISPALGLRTRPSNYPRDLSGMARGLVMNAGAYAGDHPQTPLPLAGESARHAHRSGEALLQLQAGAIALAIAGAQHSHRATEVEVGATAAPATIISHDARHEVRDGSVSLALAALLGVSSAHHGLQSEPAVVTLTFDPIVGPSLRRLRVRPETRRIRIATE
jgi:hypothetical protein